jgi:hypothetical protein
MRCGSRTSPTASRSRKSASADDGWSLRRIRKAVGLEEDLLRAYYNVEAKRYPQSVESQRLLI